MLQCRPFTSYIAAVLIFIFGAGWAHADQTTITVAAAANLQKAFDNAIIPRFEKDNNCKVVVTYGATKLLALQLQNGAPDDVFVAADMSTVARLAKEGLVNSATAEQYAVGKLVIWSRKDAMRHPRSIDDLADPAYSRISIANPDAAPYGRAAMEALTSAGIMPGSKTRIVQAENIAQALQYAQTGNADVALTALSLVIDDRGDPYIVVPEALHSPIAQSAALVSNSQNKPLARSFLKFLISKAARTIWERYGYQVP